MKTLCMALLTATLLVPLGCQRSDQSTVKGDSGEELTVAVPPTVEIAQGAEKPFSVTVNRKRINDTARVKIEGLPKGITVLENDIKFADGTNNQFVTLRATEDAKPAKELPVTVTATAGEYTASATLSITVNESLENKAASKKAFAAAMDARLNKVKSLLEDGEKQIKLIFKDDNNRATQLKRVAEHMEMLGHARAKYDTMLNTPVEIWEREKDAVVSSVASVEEAAQSLIAEFKAEK